MSYCYHVTSSKSPAHYGYRAKAVVPTPTKEIYMYELMVMMGWKLLEVFFYGIYKGTPLFDCHFIITPAPAFHFSSLLDIISYYFFDSCFISRSKRRQRANVTRQEIGQLDRAVPMKPRSWSEVFDDSPQRTMIRGARASERVCSHPYPSKFLSQF